MSLPYKRSANEYPSTYFVHDRHSQKELTRVKIQDHLVTAAMGGVLPEQSDPSIFRRVLDIGCGTGGWVLDAAQAYPAMSLAGIDVSKPMIGYAREQAQALQVAERVEFHVMDALLILEFPPDYFDLVNIRFGSSFMRIWDWPKLFSEMLRVSRPGGVIRVTEPEIFNQCTSPAHRRLNAMFQCALFHAGHLFEETPAGLTLHLADLFTRHGVQQVQTTTHTLSFQAGTPEGQSYIEDVLHLSQTVRPFLQKWGCLSQDYDALCSQLLEELRQPTYHSTWQFLTAWGTK
jgi:ubiquinone/menaquinone biosynthesis C-methylase UbiE